MEWSTAVLGFAVIGASLLGVLLGGLAGRAGHLAIREALKRWRA